ncbi:MAG: hypothetical protein ACOH5I_21145 [Oligoflexus sp.]
MPQQRSQNKNWLGEQIMRLGFSPWTLIVIFASIAILILLAVFMNPGDRNEKPPEQYQEYLGAEAVAQLANSSEEKWIILSSKY